MINKDLEKGRLKLKQPAALIADLIGTTFSFAVWSLPDSEDFSIAIDLESSKPTIDQSIDNLDATFIINSFAQNHPIAPSYIKSDILITVQQDKLGDIKINPRLSSSTLEGLFEKKKKRSLKITEIKEYPDFVDAVVKAIHHIKIGRLDKIVLSRFKDIDIPYKFEAFSFFKKLINAYPNAFNYLIYTPEHGLWLGASPEKLIKVDYLKNRFSTDALAGTQQLNGRSLDEVAWTMKEIEEQAMVSRYIVDCFKKIRLRDFHENGPKTVKAGNLAHLKTKFEVNMSDTNSPELGKVMLDLLHPTSAVCGFPREEALNFLLENEKYDRSLYAGFLGPVQFDRSTNLFVNLRCMQVFQNKMRLYAGAGITADSNPQKEFEETEHKINTLLNIL